MKKITLMAFVCAISFQLSATVWRVNNTAGVDADFASFSEAQTGASTGDTLMFEGSILPYGVVDTLFKQLTLIGPGYFIGENYPENDNFLTARFGVFNIDTLAAGSVIKGLNFSWYESSRTPNLYVSANNVVIERNRFVESIVLGKNNVVNNIVISKNFIDRSVINSTNYSSTMATNVLITNNIIDYSISLNGYSTANIVNNSVERITKCENSTIKNNIIALIESVDDCSFEYNLIEQELPANGVGNVYIEDLEGVYIGKYIADSDLSDDAQYQLSDTSAAIGIGENGVDCGAFGGNVPYVLSGFPPVPLVTNVIIPAQVTNELIIRVQAKAQE